MELQGQGTIRLTKRGTEVSERISYLQRLRTEFTNANYVRLRNLIDSDILQDLMSRIHGGEFRTRIHENVGKDACLSEDRALHILRFLVINQDFFRIVERITDCGRIGFFEGRVYRLVPGDGHFDEWHNDLIDDRLVALSINLSPEPYRGGNLHLRDDRTGEVQEIENTGFGDAVLFRLDSSMHHRVGEVYGNNAKTAFAGWFKSSPDFFARLQASKNKLAQ